MEKNGAGNRFIIADYSQLELRILVSRIVVNRWGNGYESVDV